MQRRSFMIFATEAGSCAWQNLAVISVQVGEPWKIAVWLTMLPDGSAFVQVHKSEMGQGVLTALPMLIAEELELPFSSIRVELAHAASQFRDSRYTQSTGYSSSVSSTYLPFRKLVAGSKHMLLAAAAQRWGCSVDRLEGKNASLLTHRGTVTEAYTCCKATGSIKFRP
ncbi:MAG: hypothetical protein EXR88_02935 [Gammaproteobacteria bacterium]|nr:hypothetical protein [Gammaproteobacteria bacterium]